MAIRVITDQGRTLELGRRLDEGGEGVVYEVSGASLVAKLLLQPAAPTDLARRLASLVRRSRSPRTARLLAGEPRRVAWPVAAIRVLPRQPTSAEQIHGFLMLDMRRWYRPLSYLLSPELRADRFPGSTWHTSLTAAASLARLVSDLHQVDYIVGDLKPENLWVDKLGNIGVSDVDSFQFTDGAGAFPCEARTPDYTAPECIISPDALPQAPSDDFVLAVLIHQLLMDGMHPFSGIPADGTRYVSIDDNVRHGRSTLVHPDSVRKAAGAPPFSVLPRRLRELFAQCFGDAGRLGRAPRPTALEWAGALDAECALGRLRACQADPGHVYTAERPWCPWCFT